MRTHQPKMADSSKKDKIAAAKKKLKQFQQRSGRTPSRSPARQAPPHTAAVDECEGSVKDNDKTSRKSSCNISPASQELVINISNRGRPVSKVLGNLQTSSQNEPKTSFGTNMESQNNSSQAFAPWFPSARTTASTESLHQLSRQLNGLLAETAEFTGNGDESGNSSVEELEKRNRELAASLELHSQANEQLNTQNQQLRDRVKNLQEQLESEKNTFHEKYKKDVASLKEQLQVHIQTIGILVAEKTELQSQVGQSQRIADQRLEEIEELSGRLKASRQRVADLERSLSTSSQSGHQLEKVNREHAKEIDRLKLELYKSNKGLEESQQQISELVSKLNSKGKETEEQEATIEDLRKRLEMAEIYAQQLSSETESYGGNVKMITDLETEKDTLQLKIKQIEESLQSVRQEKEQIRDHFQQNADQLTHQIQHLTKQVAALSEEREILLVKQHEQESVVLELQHKLQNSENNQQKGENIVAQAHLANDFEQLKKDLQELQERHEAQIRDNAQLSRLLEERELTVLELEQQVEQMGSEVGDRTQLLESVQSDRTALSRALSQNKELKIQLAELQNGFVKMSNDNMELVTKLQAVEHSNNDMAARLAIQEDDTKDLRELVSRKEQEVQAYKEELQVVQRQQYHQDQIQDRLRHYEAQAQLVETLQNELTSAQDMMEALTTQNSELRTMLIKATEVKQHPESSDENGASSHRDELIESLTASIRQLEMERTQLYENLKEQRHLSDNLSVKVADLQEDVIRKSTDYVNSDKISWSEYEQLKTAMEMIQEKYTRVMKDKAELSDKADQLEHLVVQLQGETDTIGEYISLYHHQRALLQQRELQKNDYISQLARDREQLQDKLGELQALVMQLLGERKMLHSYHEESGAGTQQQHDGHHHHHHPHHPHHHASLDPTIQPHLTPHKSVMNGPVENNYQDWPDYTSSESDTESEVEPIVGGTDTSPPSLLQEASDEMVTQHTHDPEQSSGQHHTHSHSSCTVTGNACTIREEDQTAHRILNLLSELGHSNLVEKVPFAERNFLPCKYCKGAIQVI